MDIFFDYEELKHALPTCVLKEYYFEDKWYNDKRLHKVFNEFNKDSLVWFDYSSDKKVSIKRNVYKDYWIFVHPTFLQSFFIKYNNLQRSEEWMRKMNALDTYEKWQYYRAIFEREIEYKGTFYYGYYLSENTLGLMGDSFVLEREQKPEIVKVCSSVISAQILNKTYSKDLLCFCPKIKWNDDSYYFKEFEQSTKVKLENSALTNIDIILTDGDNKQLQLLPGVPTVLALKFVKMAKENKSFNVRLTSCKNEVSPNNTQSAFKVQLPNTLNFNKQKNWRVALTNISHPSTYNTFVGEYLDAGMAYIPLEGSGYEKKEINFHRNKIYTVADLIKEINIYLWYFSVTLYEKPPTLTFNLTYPGLYIISNNFGKIMGFKDWDKLPTGGTTSYNVIKHFHLTLDLVKPINVNYFQPDYMIAYCSIVQPTIIGGAYKNILRMIPLLKDKKDQDKYVIHEVKNKTFLPLTNTEVNEIEINLRSHDGLLLSFQGDEDIIVNLEFSNNQV